MTQKAAGMGSWWLAASSRQHAPAHASCLPQSFFQTSNNPGESAPLQARFGALQLLAFPQTEITFEREGISDLQWQLGELCEVPQCLL